MVAGIKNPCIGDLIGSFQSFQETRPAHGEIEEHVSCRKSTTSPPWCINIGGKLQCNDILSYCHGRPYLYSVLVLSMAQNDLRIKLFPNLIINISI